MARGRRTPRSGTAGCRKSTMARRPSPGCRSSAPTGSSMPCSSTTMARRSFSMPAPCRRKSVAIRDAAPWPLGGSGRSSSRPARSWTSPRSRATTATGSLEGRR